MYRSLLFIAMAALFLIASPVEAQTDYKNNDSDDPCFSSGYAWEDCWTQSGEQSGSGNYTYCLAKSTEGQQCQDVVTFYVEGTICASGCNRCASVKHSAGCSCDSRTLQVKGSCTYW